MSSPAPLPPFSGDDPTCPKCGMVGATTTWRPGFILSECRHPGIGVLQEVEHLDRECRRCGYMCAEATVEQPQATS